MNRLSRWGVGPSIVLAALSYAAIGAIMTYFWPDTYLIRAIPYPVFLVTGASLLVIGVPMLVVAAVALTRNYDRDQLATRGIYGVVRNPIYSAWIVFLIPGLVLFARSLPLLLTPLVAYLVFKKRIVREEEYLDERFGDSYLKYRSEVNELLPIPRLRRS
ncbi:MAG: methyltransferase family protein [Isosphaeraceae bacterium]